MLAVSQAADKSFVTLTSLRATPWTLIMKGFANLLRRLKRLYPHIAYAAVKEEGHLHGMRHLHVIFLNLPFFPQAELSRLWAMYTGAPIVHIARITDERVYSYCAKYAAKESLNYKKCVTYSSSWPTLESPLSQCLSEPAMGRPVPAPGAIECPDGTLIQHIADGCHCFDYLIPPPPEPVPLPLVP